jgi:branched-chain amino acid transport system ATP-binding protein
MSPTFRTLLDICCAGRFPDRHHSRANSARPLVARPKLLLLDEPSLSLAPPIVKMIFEVICELRDKGQTILLVEQNARQALAVSSYAYVLESGTLMLEGPAQTLNSDPTVTRIHLGQTI